LARIRVVSVTTETTAASASVSTSRPGPWLPIAIWIVVALLAVTLVWAVPRAASSRASAARTGTLAATVAARQSSATAAATDLAAINGDIAAAEQGIATLRHDLVRSEGEITRLKAEIGTLQSRKAGLSPPPGTAPVYPVLPPIHPPHCVPVYGPGGSIGLKCDD